MVVKRVKKLRLNWPSFNKALQASFLRIAMSYNTQFQPRITLMKYLQVKPSSALKKSSTIAPPSSFNLNKDKSSSKTLSKASVQVLAPLSTPRMLLQWSLVCTLLHPFQDLALLRNSSTSTIISLLSMLRTSKKILKNWPTSLKTILNRSTLTSTTFCSNTKMPRRLSITSTTN